MFLIVCMFTLTSCENRPDWLPKFHIEVTDSAIDPTCGESGLTEGKHCFVCGEVFKAQEIVPPTEDHTPVTDAAVAATCTQNGLSEGSHCEKCNTTIKEQIVIPAPGHDFAYYDDHTFCKRCLAEPSDKLSYKLNYNGTSYCVIGLGECTDTEIIIPPTYNNLPVTEISERAFFSCSHITSISIPNSVTSIGNYAFYDCTGLISIIIPESITRIGNYTFYRCTELTTITFAGRIKTFGEFALYNCSSLTRINFNGTLLQWNSMTKLNGWNTNAGSYIIYCNDGKMTKNGQIQYYD